MPEKVPKIKVFINHNGNVENVYVKDGLVDVEVIKCDRFSLREEFELEYEKAEANGFEPDSFYKETVVNELYAEKVVYGT